MKLLILGASGQLGKSLLDENLEGFELHTPSSTIVNVTDFDSTKNYILELKPDFIINVTAWTDVLGAEKEVDSAYSLNCGAVGNLARTCKESDSTLVHISTDYVFDGLKTSAYTEGDAPSPLNTYGKSKLAGENEILNSGLAKFYIIRTSWLYSRYRKNFVKTVAAKSIRNEPSTISNDQFGSPTFAGDLAAGIIALLESRAKPGIYNYSNSGETNWYEFGRKIYSLAKANESLVSPRGTGATELKRPSYSPLNLSKWENAGLPKVRSWEDALSSALPEIIQELTKAGS